MLIRLDGLNLFTPPASHLSFLLTLFHSGFTLPAASPWMYCKCPPEDQVCVGGVTAQWFLSLKGDSTQMHSKPMKCFFLGGELSGYDYITTHAEEQRSDLLTYVQTDCELSQAQQKSGHLKGLANDVRPTLPTQKDLLTNSRDLWPKLFYLLYFLFFFLFLSSYIYLKIKFLKQCFRSVFHPLYLYLLNRKEEGKQLAEG